MRADKRILLLDHEMDFLAHLYTALLQQGYDVEATNDADEIIPRLQRFKPHLVLIKNNLPALDLPLIEQQLQHIPFIWLEPAEPQQAIVEKEVVVNGFAGLPRLLEKIAIALKD